MVRLIQLGIAHRPGDTINDFPNTFDFPLNRLHVSLLSNQPFEDLDSAVEFSDENILGLELLLQFGHKALQRGHCALKDGYLARIVCEILRLTSSLPLKERAKRSCDTNECRNQCLDAHILPLRGLGSGS